MAAPLRGEANRPVGNGRPPKTRAPRHRNMMENWSLSMIHRQPEFEVGDEHNIRGLAATGSRVGSHIDGTRPGL